MRNGFGTSPGRKRGERSEDSVREAYCLGGLEQRVKPQASFLFLWVATRRRPAERADFVLPPAIPPCLCGKSRQEGAQSPLPHTLWSLQPPSRRHFLLPDTLPFLPPHFPIFCTSRPFPGPVPRTGLFTSLPSAPSRLPLPRAGGCPAVSHWLCNTNLETS